MGCVEKENNDNNNKKKIIIEDPQQPPVQSERPADEFQNAALPSLTQKLCESRARGFERRSRLHLLLVLVKVVLDVGVWSAMSVARLLPIVLSQKKTYLVPFSLSTVSSCSVCLPACRIALLISSASAWRDLLDDGLALMEN